MNTPTVAPVPRERDAVLVPLTKGFSTWVSAQDAERVLAIRWRALQPLKRTNLYYAHCGAFGYLHRFIMGAKRGDPSIDHENGNSLDNTRTNLRFATSHQQNTNRRKQAVGFRGWRYRWWQYADEQPIDLSTFIAPQVRVFDPSDAPLFAKDGAR